MTTRSTKGVGSGQVVAIRILSRQGMEPRWAMRTIVLPTPQSGARSMGRLWVGRNMPTI